MCLSKKKDCCDLIFIYISKRKYIYIFGDNYKMIFYFIISYKYKYL